MIIRPKKVVLFPENVFRVSCVSEYIFLISTKKIITRQKAEESKKEKRISLENLTEYDYFVCEFALCILTYLHTFKNKHKRKSLRYIFVYDFLVYICLFVATNLL